MTATVVLACGQVGVAWYLSATYSMTMVAIMLVIAALLGLPCAYHYFIHRARGYEPTLVQTTKTFHCTALLAPATAVTAANILILSAGLLISPAVRRGTPPPPENATFTDAACALLLTAGLLAAELLLVQLPLLYKTRRMLKLQALSVDAATRSERGPAESMQGDADAHDGDSDSRATVPPNHTDPEATALWREASTAWTVAWLPVLACVQLVAAALYMHFDAGAFVAIMLTTSALPMFVVAGRYCMLRAAGQELTWKQSKTVTMDIVHSASLSLPTAMAMCIYFMYWSIWVMPSDIDGDSPDEDGLSISQTLWHDAGLLVTLFLLGAAESVNYRAILVGIKALHVLKRSYTENRWRSHFNGGSDTDHPEEQ